MSTALQIRGGLRLRLLTLLVGLFVCSAGIVAMLESRLGVGSWAVLQQGISRHSPLSFGEATILVSVVVLIAARLLGAQIGVGTLADALLIGLFIDLVMRIGWVHRLTAATLGDRAALLVFGLLSFSFGSAVYLSAAFGGGPRDALMLGLWKRTGWRIGSCRTILELGVLAVGFTLGGTVGLGTLAMAILVGPALHASFELLRRLGIVTSPNDPIISPTTLRVTG
jgi:uncharacterized membrane protein YczE